MLRSSVLALPRASVPPRDREAHAVFPLWTRWFAALALPPAASGLLASAVLFAAFLALDALDGNLHTLVDGSVPWWRHVEVRSAACHSLLLGLMLIVHRTEQRGTRRDLARLGPQLRGDGDLASLLLREAGAVDPARLRIAGGVGAAVVASLVPSLYLDPARFLRLETWLLPSVQFDLVVGAVFGWTLGKVLYAGIQQDRAFARLSGAVERIDLLDLSPLRPFARRGLRRTGRWLLLGALSAPVFLDAGLAAWPALTLAAIFALAGVSFVLPLRGIHRRIGAEKAAELKRLRAAIAHERGRLLDPAPGPDGRLADLLALEARLASAREWPLDTTIVLRLVVFGLLPVGSWLGGAFAERLLDWALG
jgi:hypothetical protein